MSNLIQFPKQFPVSGQKGIDGGEVPNYTGRLLTLNPERTSRFQCGGFFLGGKMRSAVVTEEAQMGPIHRAILDGVLLDMTECGEISTENSTLSTVQEQETGKKIYVTTTEEGNRVLYATDNPLEQQRLDAQLQQGSRLVLPEGFGNEEKYLLKLPQPEKRSVKARVKDVLYKAIQKL